MFFSFVIYRFMYCIFMYLITGGPFWSLVYFFCFQSCLFDLWFWTVVYLSIALLFFTFLHCSKLAFSLLIIFLNDVCLEMRHCVLFASSLWTAKKVGKK